MDQGHKRIILASASPRRRELLSGLGLEFEVDTRNSFEESCEPETPAHEVPLLMARGKSHGFHRPLEEDEILITADTVVIAKDAAGRTEVLGKPHSAEEAKRMLAGLSGRWHSVYTGVTMIDTRSGKTLSRADVTRVHFVALTAHDIDAYVATGEPLDKAGAYGIQGRGGMFIDRIEGSYSNVVGLPMALVRSMLLELEKPQI